MSDPRHSALARCLRRRLGDRVPDARIEGLGENVVRAQLLVGDQRCKSLRGRNLHRVVDIARPDVQSAAEDTGEAQDVVDLVGEVASACGYHCRARRLGLIGEDLGQAKMMGSFAMVRTMSCVRVPGADTPMKTSAPLMTSARDPAS